MTIYDRSAEHRLEVVIVTGLSGSGKSTAIRVLEDLGYYCIDNLPVALMPRFLELCAVSREGLSRVALGVDIRAREFLTAFPDVLESLRSAGHWVRLVFLDASDDVLVRRFSETRRPHPLGQTGGPLSGIRREREELAALRGRADRIFDTSALTVHQLRDELRRFYDSSPDHSGMSLLMISFGFKFGVPSDVDMVFDVRFLANPYFAEDLRAKTGQDEAVSSFVLKGEEARGYVRLVTELLRFTLPLHRAEGRSYLTVAVGCTDGRHRSVAVAERLASEISGEGCRVQVQHRDILR